MQKTKLIFALALALSGMAFFVSPAKADGTSQAQCFQTLKDNMTEAGTFSAPLQEMNKLSYLDLEANFSRNYKNLSSFGIDIDQPNFEMRVYSFGKQTGYVHPALSPFPTSTKADSWDAPAKEFIIVEEYVSEPGKEKHFMDCAFISISAADLMRVTRENYLYDGPMISLNKTAKDGAYKSWYSEMSSFDYASKPLAKWRRLFVYPKSAQNEYFDKYAVADAYPGNKVESLEVLKFFSQPMVRLQAIDENGQAKLKFITFDEKDSTKAPIELSLPAALSPIVGEGINKTFPLNEYYQAIENRFPEFAKLLSFRGSLKFETFKKLLAEEQTPEVNTVLNTLLDYRQLAGYMASKRINEKDGVVVTDPEMDRLLLDVADADATFQKLSNKETPTNVSGNMETNKAKLRWIIGLIAFFSIGVFALAIIWKKYNKANN